MNYFKKLYNFIYSRGVIGKNKLDDKLTSLLNIISFLTALGSFGIFLMAYKFTTDYIYMSVTIGVSAVYFVLIILHHFHQMRLAKLYFSTIIPLWYVSTMFCIGGNFSQSISAAASVGITFLMFRNEVKLRNYLIIYNILLYVLPSLYVTLYEPFFGIHDYPIDEVVVFLLCIGWISIVFSYYEQKTQSQIDSLINTNRKLEQKTLEMERFTYIASHDLKSPLNNVGGFLSLIRRDIEKKEYNNLLEYLEYVETGTLQMNELIEGVSEITQTDNLAPLTYSDVDLNKSMEKALLNLKNEIDNSKAIINYTKLPHYICNEDHFIIIFQKIIHNAIKYNNSKPPIVDISCYSAIDKIVIKIKDNGIGIKQKYYDQIFIFFKKLHISSEYSGTGLGLGLVKKLINIYHGNISVDSVFGKFTCFEIELPKLKTTNAQG